MRYKHQNGIPIIEVRVNNIQQLFDARDPAPFRERDLDDDFVSYIMSSVKEFPMVTPVRLKIYIEEIQNDESIKGIVIEAIKSFLSYQIDVQKRDLKSFLKRAQYFLMIGLIILIISLGIAQSIVVTEPPGLVGILRDGIIIFGWVSIWKPIELILFDWFPIYEQLKYYQKVNDAEIEIISKSK